MPFIKWKLQENDINYIMSILLDQQDGHNVIDIIFL